MNVTGDQVTDALTIISSSAAVAESDEYQPDIILDYDEAGNIVSTEIRDASRRVIAPDRMDYRINTAV